jgi:hypothetical protein
VLTARCTSLSTPGTAVSGGFGLGSGIHPGHHPWEFLEKLEKVASSCLVVESCVNSRLGGGELLWVMVSICYPLQEHLSTLHCSISGNNSEENFMEHFLLLLV